MAIPVINIMVNKARLVVWIIFFIFFLFNFNILLFNGITI